MARTPTNFFTAERRQLLEELLGALSFADEQMLQTIGRYSAKELWPLSRYQEINDPQNDHKAFREAMTPLIDPAEIGFRGCFLPINKDDEPISIPAFMMGLEMLAQGNGSIAISLAIDASVLNSIWGLGDDGQKERYVRKALEEKRMTAFSLTEPGHGSDAANLETRAAINDGHYLLNGQKTLITNAGWADYYFVVVRTNPDRKLKGNGLSILMMHKDEISSIRQIGKYTVDGSYNAELFFTDAKVPIEDDGVRRMIGAKDSGFALAKNLLMGGRVTIAAYGLGVATEALEDAVDYARERISDDEPIFEKQVIRLKLGELKAQLDAYRTITYMAALKMA